MMYQPNGSFERVDVTTDRVAAPTGQGVRVGVIDSGWDRSIDDHRIDAGYGFVSARDEWTLERSSDDQDRVGHGTMCADIILQVAPNAHIVPLRVFGRRLETTPALVIDAIHFAVEQQLTLINMSLGTMREDAVSALFAACHVARDAGIVIVAAVSNGPEEWSYPAVFGGVIGVGASVVRGPYGIADSASAALDFVAARTHFARSLRGVERSASGTSFAAAVVTGHAACVKELHPGADIDEVRRTLKRRVAQRMRPSARMLGAEPGHSTTS
jgi:subtilisin family serine protease